ncbi:MAG: hypothetical protein ACOX3X_05155 [Eubacteriales bacterium]|jgi:hypothetical protein
MAFDYPEKLNIDGIPDGENNINPENAPEDAPERVPDDIKSFKDVFDDTMFFVTELVSSYDYYPEIINMVAEGASKVSLSKRYLLKAIDETWISAVEECLMAIDNLIRNPSRFIEETDKVVPIEMSKSITSRSIKHLAQHTDYINKIEGDMIIPSKILNVYREETILTYENKFLNTLINKLYLFVNKRYETAKRYGRDEKVTSLNFTSDFVNGQIKGKLTFGIELSEQPEDNVKLKNQIYTTDLWKRVVHLNEVVTAYMTSEFCKAMGQNFIRPPVMHTNAITKNRYLRQCLALYQFIESYENTGYNIVVEETAEELDEEYVKELYSMAAIQYLIFRSKIGDVPDEDRTIAEYKTDTPLKPRFETEIKPVSSDEYNITDTTYQKQLNISRLSEKKKLSPSEVEMRNAIDIALAAEEYLEEIEAEKRRAAEEEAKRLAELEAMRKAEEEERRRLEEEARLRAEEEAKLLAELEAKRQAEEEERQRILEEEKRKAEEAARIKAEEEEKIKAEEEEKRRREEEIITAAKRAAEEAARILAEEKAKQLAKLRLQRVKKYSRQKKDSVKSTQKTGTKTAEIDGIAQVLMLSANLGRKKKKQLKKSLTAGKAGDKSKQR